MEKRLYRSRTNKVVGGVCGGLGRYLGVDPIVIRIIFILLAIGQGFGVLLYILLWILLPEEGAVESAAGSAGDKIAEGVRGVGEDIRQAAQTPNPQAGIWFGVGLIVIGGFLLVEKISEYFNLNWLAWVNTGNLWPVLLIVIGVAFLMRGMRRGE
jgi:phage shock protein PspC (stress-responsive transcriptional regulator)